MNNDDLYKTLNGMNKITDEDAIQLSVIKKNLNENNWELLIENENLLIITELLFSWLNESVTECINPKKIQKLWNKCSKLFNGNTNNQKKVTDSQESNSNISNTFEEFMRGDNPIPKNKIFQFINIFQIIFSKTEVEIIKFLSLFLTLIYPRVNIENNNNISANLIREYKRFMFKLCFFLLGYNLDKVNAISDNKNLKEFIDAKRFILILEFFIFYSSKDENNKTKNNNNLNNDWLSNFMKLKNEYEENEIKNNDDIIAFLNKKPKNDFISVKYFFITENS